MDETPAAIGVVGLGKDSFRNEASRQRLQDLEPNDNLHGAKGLLMRQDWFESRSSLLKVAICTCGHLMMRVYMQQEVYFWAPTFGSLVVASVVKNQISIWNVGG